MLDTLEEAHCCTTKPVQFRETMDPDEAHPFDL